MNPIIIVIVILKSPAPEEKKEEKIPKETTFDFGDGKGHVAAHRHKNPNGELGGWVANTAIVGTNCYVGPEAQVSDNAQVYNTRIDK